MFVLVAGLSSFLAALVLDRAVARRVTEQIAARLGDEVRLARDLARAEPDLPSTADRLADRLGRDLGVRVTIISSDGAVLGDTDLDGAALREVENHASRPEVMEAVRDGTGRSMRYSRTVAENMLYVASRIDPDDPARGVIRLALPLTDVTRAQEAVRVPILLAAVLSLLVAGLIGWAVARGPARRLEAIARVASQFAAGRMDVRAEPGGDDETSVLARSLNRMADQLEERLILVERERSQLRTVLEGMVEGVVLTDPTGRILVANDAFRRIFDAQLPVEGRRPLETARVPALQDAIESALEADEPLTREIALGGAQQKVIQASLAAIRERGATVGAVAVFHDVTELKRLERVRQEFVANVSHELRTPLTAIKGYAETLRDGGLRDPETAAEFVRVIHRHAERLRALIEDLLDLAAVEQGEARLKPAVVRARDVVAQAEGLVRPAAEARGQTLAIDLPADLPDILADRDRLAQILINLLDNAVKFTPEGGRVTLSAKMADGRVVLAVSDNGVGIPPGDLPRIFERFYRVGRSRDRREGGTGLGLAIAKHLTQAMGGTIEVESTQGSGTTFRVSLPSA
ncbi:MAG TPA: ATP-binding protein [Candidatus Dormibacteraeota bacterium]|nr:ATP-binding protein [Candidatus Dormibacteraeota bacterium]